jgi:hypothetical protein
MRETIDFPLKLHYKWVKTRLSWIFRLRFKKSCNGDLREIWTRAQTPKMSPASRYWVPESRNIRPVGSILTLGGWAHTYTEQGWIFTGNRLGTVLYSYSECHTTCTPLRRWCRDTTRSTVSVARTTQLQFWNVAVTATGPSPRPLSAGVSPSSAESWVAVVVKSSTKHTYL